MALNIVIAGPIAGADVKRYLDIGVERVPSGYPGAPLTGILIGQLLQMGHRVTGITTDATLPLDQSPIEFSNGDFKFVACPSRPKAWRMNGKRLGRILDFFAFERSILGRSIAAAGADIVHAHWTYEFSLAALNQTTPCLITCHDAPNVVLKFSKSPYRALRLLMARKVFRTAAEFSAVSSYLAEALEDSIGYAAEVIPNPISNEFLRKGKARATYRAKTGFRVGMVCNGWDRRKNPMAGLRGFALWRKNVPEAELHLYGADFGVGEAAEAWANAEGLADGVHFHGRISHGELADALGAVDALLHSSLEESFGVVIAEAMALGLPVLGGRESGAVPWVMGADSLGHSSAGVLVDVRSPEAIAAGLIELFDEGYQLRSTAAICRAQSAFSPESVAAAYERRYFSILGSDHKRLNGPSTGLMDGS
jgi:glycosyltransferase involved in cell wall biosynthesis